MNNKIIYLDHSATTYTDPLVVKAMEPYFTEEFYNPSSLYSPARAVAKAVNDSRKTITELIGAKSEKEIIFTSSGSEGDNMAIFGIPFANRNRGRHIITTAIEHPAVINTVKAMDRFGFDYTIVPVDKFGTVDMAELKKAVREDTVLISVMFANNEVGTIQPIGEIGAMCRERGIFFHTDAVQAVGSVPINVEEMKIDALTMAGHKFYGPKGAGALYLRNGIAFETFMQGGHQEMGRRAGTHNNPGIVGLAKALEIACEGMEENNRRIKALRDRLIKGILETIPDSSLNGHPERRLPNNTNFCFKYIESEAILLHLDMLGVCASSGSACSSGSDHPSHVLEAMGIPAEFARSSVRMTLGKGTTEEEIDFVLEKMRNITGKLRMMSPLGN